MATIQLAPAGTYGPLDQRFGPAAIAQGATRFKVTVGTANLLDPAQVLTFAFEISFDGGASWGELMSGSVAGNNPAPHSKDGSPVVSFSSGLADPTNANRQARVRVILTGPPLTTSGVTLDVT